MLVRIQEWGDNLAVRFPRAFVTQSGIVQGCLVEMSLEEGRIILLPLKAPEVALNSLLGGVTEANCHNEIVDGPPCGRECW